MPTHATSNQAQAAYENNLKCHRYALFMSDAGSFWVGILPWILPIISAALTQWIRSITPHIWDEAKPKVDPVPSCDTETTTSTTELTSDATIEVEGDDPPPYQLPVVETSSTAAPVVSTSVTSPTPAAKKRTSAALFVMGTSMFIGVLSCLFVLALDIQKIIFCDGEPASTGARIFGWALYCIPALWATLGACCWLMLLRDLWGPAMKKKIPINEFAVVIGLFCAIIAPFAAIWYIFGEGAVKAIEACQRRFCGDALEEERESIELGNGLRNDADDQAEGSTPRLEEERVGLMNDMEK